MSKHFRCGVLPLVFLTSVLFSHADEAPPTGLIQSGGQALFPIGFYELPDGEAGLQAMAESGANLVRCHDAVDLDRAGAVGITGWIPLNVQEGATDALRDRVAALQAHPALAVWEGPDELVWNFTAYSGIEEIAGVKREDWWGQAPNAVAYAKARAAEIMPKMHEAIALVRELDDRDRPFWMNEARESDLIYVRQYLDSVDVIGCDDYPVRVSGASDLHRVGRATEYWKMAGEERPVWMVLQAFAWKELDGRHHDATSEYPAFWESRFMAYDVIAHGARGILYWGSDYLQSPEFRESLYALTRELAALQPFLTAPVTETATVRLIESPDEAGAGVRCFVRQAGGDWLVILVNEDQKRHMGVEVRGLDAIAQQRLFLLYDDEQVAVESGRFLTRMPEYAVKVFSTSRRFEASPGPGRDFDTHAR